MSDATLPQVIWESHDGKRRVVLYRSAAAARILVQPEKVDDHADAMGVLSWVPTGNSLLCEAMADVYSVLTIGKDPARFVADREYHIQWEPVEVPEKPDATRYLVFSEIGGTLASGVRGWYQGREGTMQGGSATIAPRFVFDEHASCAPAPLGGIPAVPCALFLDLDCPKAQEHCARMLLPKLTKHIQHCPGEHAAEFLVIISDAFEGGARPIDIHSLLQELKS